LHSGLSYVLERAFWRGYFPSSIAHQTMSFAPAGIE
jgi:hypothetical protein